MWLFGMTDDRPVFAGYEPFGDDTLSAHGSRWARKYGEWHVERKAGDDNCSLSPPGGAACGLNITPLIHGRARQSCTMYRVSTARAAGPGVLGVIADEI